MANISSSTFPEEIARTDLCVVGDWTVVFRGCCWCEFLVRTSMAMLMRAATNKLNNPVAPTIHTMLSSFPSTPRLPRRYTEAIAVIVMSPPCICCHHFKSFRVAIDESSHTVSL